MPAIDAVPFNGAPMGPFRDGFVVTLSDTVDFATISSALWVPTAKATLTIVLEKGTVLQFGAVPAGTLLPVRAKRINATNSAPGNDIVALF